MDLNRLLLDSALATNSHKDSLSCRLLFCTRQKRRALAVSDEAKSWFGLVYQCCNLPFPLQLLIRREIFLGGRNRPMDSLFAMES